jgi:hypothetical protein
MSWRRRGEWRYHHWHYSFSEPYLSLYDSTTFVRSWEFDRPVSTFLDFAKIIFFYRASSSALHQIRNLEDQVSVFMSPHWQGGPAIPPGTGLPFRCLLHLAGLWWRYSNPPPHGEEWRYSSTILETYNLKEMNSVAFSPQGNYTERATTACRRS